MRYVRRTVGLLVVLGMLCGLFASESAARQRMSFRPGDRARPAAAHHGRSGRSAWPGRHFGGRRGAHGSRSQMPQASRRHSGGDVDEGGGSARPGAGFTMENGVLTYPAPERFQPRNLPHR